MEQIEELAGLLPANEGLVGLSHRLKRLWAWSAICIAEMGTGYPKMRHDIITRSTEYILFGPIKDGKILVWL